MRTCRAARHGRGDFAEGQDVRRLTYEERQRTVAGTGPVRDDVASACQPVSCASRVGSSICPASALLPMIVGRCILLAVDGLMRAIPSNGRDSIWI